MVIYAALGPLYGTLDNLIALVKQFQFVMQNFAILMENTKCMRVCMCICMHACVYMYVCTHACMYACMYECMYACMYYYYGIIIPIKIITS